MSLKIQDKKSYQEVNKNKLRLQKRKEMGIFAFVQRNRNGRKGKVGMTGVVHN